MVYLNFKISDVLSYLAAPNWKDVKLDFNDWDTPSKILMLNELDAKFNNMSLEELVLLIK